MAVAISFFSSDEAGRLAEDQVRGQHQLWVSGQGRLDVVEFSPIETERLFDEDVLSVVRVPRRPADGGNCHSWRSRQSGSTDRPGPGPRRFVRAAAGKRVPTSASFSGDKSHRRNELDNRNGGRRPRHVEHRRPGQSLPRPGDSRRHLRRASRAGDVQLVTQSQDVVDRVVPMRTVHRSDEAGDGNSKCSGVSTARWTSRRGESRKN